MAEPRSPGSGAAQRRLGHMDNADIISMPDKWEYPWYAAWDLAFHTLALGLVDPDFAKEQLELMLRERYLHPNGQMPAYEWNFGDVNPPVHAWATVFTLSARPGADGAGRPALARRQFNKLLAELHLVGQPQGPRGRNVFEGGFLGLDNIGVFDRSRAAANRRLSGAGGRHRLDGLFCQNMLEMALELARRTRSTRIWQSSFLTHFLCIGVSDGPAGR